jgi:guanylate kinase
MNKKKKSGKLFVISAPSGAGKTTLINELVHRLGDTYKISKVITYTTRPPRTHETNGKDYYFLTSNDFAKKKEEGFFIETSVYDNYWYGSPASILRQLPTGKSFIIATDRPGARSIKKHVPDAVFIWITVPNIETLKQRMLHRGTKNAEILEQRIVLATKEMEEEKQEQWFAYHVINDDFTTALNELENIIKNELEGQ